MNTDTPTPRTDTCEREYSADTSKNPQYRLTVLCRQLERELADAKTLAKNNAIEAMAYKKDRDAWASECEVTKAERDDYRRERDNLELSLTAAINSSNERQIEAIEYKRQRDALAEALKIERAWEHEIICTKCGLREQRGEKPSADF
jgi:hypothetical protein